MYLPISLCSPSLFVTLAITRIPPNCGSAPRNVSPLLSDSSSKNPPGLIARPDRRLVSFPPVLRGLGGFSGEVWDRMISRWLSQMDLVPRGNMIVWPLCSICDSSRFQMTMGRSEFTPGLSFVVLCLIACTYNRYGRLVSKCFLRRKRQRPSYAEASRHRTNPDRVCAAGIWCVVWEGEQT